MLQSALYLAALSGLSLDLVQTVEKTENLAPKGTRTGGAQAQGVPTLRIDATKPGQRLEGFGGAITDSVAQVFSQLNATLQDEVLDAIWGSKGQAYRLGRLTIGATDFSTTEYSYSNVEGDYAMANFSIDHDKANILPMILRAQEKAGGAIKWLSTPWSPPAWMKRNKHMRNSKKPGLNEDNKTHAAYALYLSKYLTAYKAEGVNITRMTVQNEPHVAGQFAATYPCCGFDGEHQRDFVKSFLGPQLRADHPEIEIWVHDDQKDQMIDPVTTIMSDPEAASFVTGVAYHWYGSNLKNYQFLAQLRSLYPNLPTLATEATLEAPTQQVLTSTPWKEAQKYAVDIIGDLNQGSVGWIEWNVLLDKTGGPTCIGPSDTNVCTPLIGHCDAPILADLDAQTISYRDSFYVMAHFSRFIPPGSRWVPTYPDASATVNVTAAVTPSNELVVVVLNTEKTNTTYQLQVNGEYFEVPIPGHSVQTLRGSL